MHEAIRIACVHVEAKEQMRDVRRRSIGYELLEKQISELLLNHGWQDACGCIVRTGISICVAG